MKKQVILIIATIIFCSCNQENTKIIETNTKNEKVVITYFDHFNNHEWEAMANMYVENADFKDPSLGNGIVKQTKKEVITKYTGLNKVFSDLKDDVIKIYPSGENHVIVEFISSGTAPDNSTFELPICAIFTIENGKITKDFTYYDNFEE